MVGTLADAARTALRARTDALQRTASVNHDGLDDDLAVFKIFAVILVLGFPVCDCAAEKLLETDGCLFLRIFENIQSVVNLLSPDDVCHEAHLLGGSGYIIQLCDSCLLLDFFKPVGHFSFTFSHCSLSSHFNDYRSGL